MKVITFLQPYQRPIWRARAAGDESGAIYNPGETAGFPNDEAEQLIASGLAVPTSTTTTEASQKGSTR